MAKLVRRYCAKRQFHFMTVFPALKSYKDRMNKQLIQIIVSDGKKRKYISTDIKILKDDWDEKTLQVKYTNQNYRSYNSTIKRLILEAEIGAIEKPDMEDVDFLKYVQDCIAEWENSKASETIRQHWSEFNKIQAMPPKYLTDLNLKWLQKYSAYLYSIGNSTNTVWKSMKFIKTVIRKAYKEQLIASNPFDLFDNPKYTDPEKSFLTKDQVESMYKFVMDPHLEKEMAFAGAWFVIGCYTGLRFTDMTLFSKSNIRAGRLITRTHKQKEVVSMPVTDKLKKLFERVEYKPVHYHNVHFNRLVKAVAVKCEIEQHVSCHVSRHTFGNMCAEAGISQEVTAKLMGHRDLKSTAIYYKISNSRVDKELEKIQ